MVKNGYFQITLIRIKSYKTNLRCSGLLIINACTNQYSFTLYCIPNIHTPLHNSYKGEIYGRGFIVHMELSIKDKFFFWVTGSFYKQINYRNCSPVFRGTIGTVVLYLEELQELQSCIQRNYRNCSPVFRETVGTVVLYLEKLQELQSCIQRNYRNCSSVFRETIGTVVLYLEELQELSSCIQKNYRSCSTVFKGTIGAVVLY